MIVKIAKIGLFIQMIILAIIGFFLIISMTYMYISVPERFSGYSPLILSNAVGLFFMALSYVCYYFYKKLKNTKLPQ